MASRQMAASEKRWILQIVASVCILVFLGFLLVIMALDRQTVVPLMTPALIAMGALVFLAVLPLLPGNFKSVKFMGLEIQTLDEKIEEIKGQQGQLKGQQDELVEQQQMLNDLVRYSMSYFVLHHLCGMAGLYDYRYTDTPEIRREMSFLKDNGFIHPRKRNTFIDFNALLDGCNLVDIVELTPIGWLCLKARQKDVEKILIGWRREKQPNIKEYVWEEIEKDSHYPYNLQERIAKRESEEEQRKAEREETIKRVLEEEASFTLHTSQEKYDTQKRVPETASTP